MRYTLVNPWFSGSFDRSTTASNDVKAAKKLYLRMSQYFSNNLPSFFFSVKDENGVLTHYECNERRANRDVTFTIRSVSMQEAGEKKLEELIEQKGGEKKKDDDSSSSSSSSSSGPIRRYYPVVDGFTYLAQYYTIDGYPIPRYFFPVFPSYLTDFYPIIIGY